MILSTHSYMDCKSLTFLCPVMTPLGCKIELMFGELHLMYNCVPICNSNENATELTKASW